MAGSALKKTVRKAIEEAGGWEKAVVERVANGESMQSIATDFGCSRVLLSRLVDADPEVRKAVAAARLLRAEKWADETLEIADSVLPDKDEVARAKVRIETRKWLAAVDDPERYGRTAQTQVNLSIGELHLNALRRMQTIDLEPEDDG